MHLGNEETASEVSEMKEGYLERATLMLTNRAIQLENKTGENYLENLP